MTLLHWADDKFRVGVLALDQTHWEMVQLLNNLDQLPPARFADLYAELVRHTCDHFLAEERLMEETGFPDREAHLADHQWVLARLEELRAEVGAGKVAATRAWLREHLAVWFQAHLIDHDRPLAEHVKAQTLARGALYPRRSSSPD